MGPGGGRSGAGWWLKMRRRRWGVRGRGGRRRSRFGGAAGLLPPLSLGLGGLLVASRLGAGPGAGWLSGRRGRRMLEGREGVLVW